MPVFFILLWLLLPDGPPADADQDSLPDEFEDRILQVFRPKFHVSRTDCDVLPSEFEPGAKAPKSVARNGAIYGQVFPLATTGRSGFFLEVHYLHLWKQDCGRAGHALDAEHVSALLTAPAIDAPVHDWKAVYWYAAAHEDTLCDAGNGARAESLDAERKGPHVWLSHGKHASYLTLELCKVRGCGGDLCRDMVLAPEGPLINLGEWDHLRNGATWVRGGPWSMKPKFQPDFTPAALAMFDGLGPEGSGSVNSSLAPVKAVMMAGGEAAGGVQTAGQQTDKALQKADRHATSALDQAASSTGNALSRALRSTGRSLKKAAEATGLK
ncbi:MAG: hypothetical protein HY821_06995 [Acidobacteria bacterium]|nr:hypothetical protein [Acidobacteriota bacterium]